MHPDDVRHGGLGAGGGEAVGGDASSGKGKGPGHRTQETQETQKCSLDRNGNGRGSECVACGERRPELGSCRKVPGGEGPPFARVKGIEKDTKILGRSLIEKRYL